MSSRVASFKTLFNRTAVCKKCPSTKKYESNESYYRNLFSPHLVRLHHGQSTTEFCILFAYLCLVGWVSCCVTLSHCHTVTQTRTEGEERFHGCLVVWHCHTNSKWGRRMISWVSFFFWHLALHLLERGDQHFLSVLFPSYLFSLWLLLLHHPGHALAGFRSLSCFTADQVRLSNTRHFLLWCHSRVAQTDRQAALHCTPALHFNTQQLRWIPFHCCFEATTGAAFAGYCILFTSSLVCSSV